MFNAMLENMLNPDTEIIYYVPEMFYSIVFKLFQIYRRTFDLSADRLYLPSARCNSIDSTEVAKLPR